MGQERARICKFRSNKLEYALKKRVLRGGSESTWLSAENCGYMCLAVQGGAVTCIKVVASTRKHRALLLQSTTTTDGTTINRPFHNSIGSSKLDSLTLERSPSSWPPSRCSHKSLRKDSCGWPLPCQSHFHTVRPRRN